MALEDLNNAQQRVIEDLRSKARALQARGGAGDKEAGEAILEKIAILQSGLDSLRASQGKAKDDGRPLSIFPSGSAAPPPLAALDRELTDAERLQVNEELNRAKRSLTRLRWRLNIMVIVFILATAAIIVAALKLFGWR
jgi:hypothetical protein